MTKTAKRRTPDQRERDLGAFYTPAHTVRRMLALLGKGADSDTWLEPSGGDGAFVKEIVAQGTPPARITVWDINANTRGAIEALGAQFHQRDTLLDTDFRSNGRDLYTRIAGNPPYLSKSSGYIKANRKELGRRFPEISAAEAYGMFLFLAANMLEPDGELVFIISDSYRTLTTHERLRRHLLQHMSIRHIDIMPGDLFKDTGTTVATSIIHLVNRKPKASDVVEFNDCRDNPAGDYRGLRTNVRQNEILSRPGAVLVPASQANQDLEKIFSRHKGKLLDLLKGGIGMHTKSNSTYLARIDRGDGQGSKRIPGVVPEASVGAGKMWRVYHKSGGIRRYWTQCSTAIKWDEAARKTYIQPATFQETMGDDVTPILVSGVSSSLSARIGEKGAAWNSNKCFGFVSRNASKYPPLFFVGLLNSATYRQLMGYVNHTSSIQVSDLRQLPMFPFTTKEVEEVTSLTGDIVSRLHKGEKIAKQDEQIDLIVARAALRDEP